MLTYTIFTRFYWKPHVMTVVTSAIEVQFKISNLQLKHALSCAITEPSFSNRYVLLILPSRDTRITNFTVHAWFQASAEK